MGIGAAGSFEKLVGEGEAQTLVVGPVTADMCTIFRIQPQIGRCFTADEESQEAPVVLLSHSFWHNRFGGDTAIVGRTLTLADESQNRILTIIGVMPERFRLFSLDYDAWMPAPIKGEVIHWGQVLGRLKPGVDIRQALAEARTLQRRLLPQNHEGVGGMRIVVQTFQDHVARRVRPGLWILLSAAGLVLLIACANVASLLLGYGIERTREVAVRESMGASRARLCRQFFTESLALAFLGGSFGVAAAYWMLQGIRSVSVGWLPRLDEAQMTGSVFLFSVVASLMSAILFGLLPAIRLSRIDLVTAMKTGSAAAIGGRHQQTAMNYLVVFQTAVCMVAMMGAGLLVNTVIRLQNVDSGINPANAVKVHLSSPRSQGAAGFFREVLDRVQAVPGVKAAGTVNLLLPNAAAFEQDFRLPGMAPGTYSLKAFRTTVSPGYFDAVGTSLRKGRIFDSRDRQSTTPVVVVSESLASKYWPDGDAPGKAIVVPFRNEERTLEIVGVVEDVRDSGLREQPRDHIYGVYTQGTPLGTTLVVRTEGDPVAMITPLKEAIRSVDKDQALDDFSTLEAHIGEMILEPRFFMILLGSFAAVALGLTALGVGGLAAYSVRRRTREIGLRIAFGATSAGLHRLFASATFKFVAAGLVMGAAASFALTQYFQSLLFGITPADPLTFAAVAAVLSVVALTSCALASRRATRIEPASVLRED
jgi:putative ABC transport system permease protein